MYGDSYSCNNSGPSNKADINTIWGQFMSMVSGENCISAVA